MESANFGQFYHPTELGRLNRPRYRRILLQGQVRACALVVFEIRLQDAMQTGFIPDDDMVQALATDRAYQSLNVRILPR